MIRPVSFRLLATAATAFLATNSVAAAGSVTSAPTLTLEGARQILADATAYARAHGAPGGAIAVVDAAGILVSLDRLDGTFPSASNISIGKARTAALFRKPTRDFETLVNQGRYTMTTLPDLTPFTPLQGGVPITANGAVIGAVGVSGAASAKQDDEIAQAAVDAFAKAQAATAAIHHVPRATVEQAYRDDANLVTADGFRVNASRRDRPGDAEVHLHETDIFYVREGRATLVTGGTVVEPRNVSATEIRGRAIDQGEERRLEAGDVITVPSGVPHWFKSVEAPFTYYVVKSSAVGG
ncbi:MAG TPA: heme-binding protein [Steroidobacteraceae bacterium]|nr:heme-binding protein [Steroidobacteraceae bacterium]